MPDGEMQTWTYDQFRNAILHKVYGKSNGTTDTTANQTTCGIYDIRQRRLWRATPGRIAPIII